MDGLYFGNKSPVNIFAKYPFFHFLIPLVAGILFEIKCKFSLSRELLAAAVFFYVFLMFYSGPKRFLPLKTVFALFLLLYTGMYSVYRVTPAVPELKKEPVVISGIVSDEPRQGKKTVYTVVDVDMFRDSSGIHKKDFKLLTYFPKDSKASGLHYGDRIIFFAEPKRIESSDNPFLFDYAKYTSRKGIYYSAYADSEELDVLAHGQGNRIIAFSGNLRSKLIALYEKSGFTGEKLDVLSALTLGYKRGLDRETVDKFAVSGAMHILAVSGLHVGIIFMILLFVLKPFSHTEWGRWLSFAIIIVFLWGFALLTGLSPSVKRSAFMFSLVAFSRTLKRKTNIYNTLAASAFFLLIFNPYDLFNVGFWLSYSAVFSIVYLQPKIYGLLNFKNILADKIWSLTAVSIAAQFGTLPLSLYVFHRFPVYFIITNIMVIPLAGIILYLAVLLIAFSWFEPLFVLTGKLLSWALDALLKSVSYIRSLPYSSVEDIYFSFAAMFFLYSALFMFAFIFIYKRKRYVFGFLLSVALFLSARAYDRINLVAPERMIFYSVPGHSLMLYVSPSGAAVLADSALINDKLRLDYYVKPYLSRASVKDAALLDIDTLSRISLFNGGLQLDRGFVVWDGKLMFMLGNDDLTGYKAQKVVGLTYLLLRNNVYLKNIKNLFDLFDTGVIIADGSNSSYKIKQWKEQALQENIHFVDVSSECFIVK